MLLPFLEESQCHGAALPWGGGSFSGDCPVVFQTAMTAELVELQGPASENLATDWVLCPLVPHSTEPEQAGKVQHLSLPQHNRPGRHQQSPDDRGQTLEAPHRHLLVRLFPMVFVTGHLHLHWPFQHGI